MNGLALFLGDDTGHRMGAVVVMWTGLCCLAFDDYTGGTTTAAASVIAHHYSTSWKRACFFATASTVYGWTAHQLKLRIELDAMG